MRNIIWKLPDGTFAETRNHDEMSSDDLARSLIDSNAIPTDWEVFATDQHKPKKKRGNN